MGKRRDRRHAVLGGGGRRVKLDLRNDEDKVPLAAGFEGWFLVLITSFVGEFFADCRYF